MRPIPKQRGWILVLLFGLCSTLCSCSLLSNAPPVARVVALPSRGVSPLDVRLEASTSFDPDGHIVRWRWEFGDGHTGSGEIVTHRFLQPGTYLVRLSVRDNRGASSVATVNIEVARSNEPPTVRIAARPLQGDAPLLVTFDGSASTDEDGEVVRWDWDFGDGQSATGAIVSHRYVDPGEYTVSLTVTDDLAGQSSSTITLEVLGPRLFQRQFTWEYAGRRFDWTISIPSALYYEYRQRIRGWWGQRDYDEYVLDPLDDAYLEGLVGWIRAQVGNDFYRVAECAFHFVQAGIDYTYDPAWYEYPRYPLETLVDETGDCEDTAILYASLVRTLGAGAMLAAVDTNQDDTVDHMVTLVPVSRAYADTVTCDHGCVRSFWTYNGQLYAFAETTGEPSLSGYYFSLGCDPWGLSSADFKLTWDVSRVEVEPKVEPWFPSDASPGPTSP